MKTVYQILAALVLALPLAASAQCETPEVQMRSLDAFKVELDTFRARQAAAIDEFLDALVNKAFELNWTQPQREAFIAEIVNAAEFTAMQQDMAAQQLKVVQIRQSIEKAGRERQTALVCTIALQYRPLLREAASIHAQQIAYLHRKIDEAR